jgi:hypothetical protein
VVLVTEVNAEMIVVISVIARHSDEGVVLGFGLRRSVLTRHGCGFVVVLPGYKDRLGLSLLKEVGDSKWLWTLCAIRVQQQVGGLEQRTDITTQNPVVSSIMTVLMNVCLATKVNVPS